MADLNNRLSAEDIRKFEQTLANFDASLARQEEIAKKVLDIEKDIGKVRIGSLNKFVEAYSVALDKVIARKTSDLNDVFLVMEREATKSFKRAADKATSEASKDNTKKDSNNNNGGNSNNGGSGGDGSNGGSNKPPNVSISTSQIIDDAQIAELNDGLDGAADEFAHTAQNIVDRLAAFEAKYKNPEEQENALEEDQLVNAELIEEARKKQKDAWQDAYAKKETKLEETLTELRMARYQTEEQQQQRLKDIQIGRVQAVKEAELKAQNFINDLVAEQEYARQNPEEAGKLRSQQVDADNDLKSAQELADKMAKFRAEKEYLARRKNNGKLSEQEAKEIDKQVAKKFKLEKENLDKLTKERQKQETAEKRKEARAAIRDDLNTLTGAGHSLTDRWQAMKDLTHNKETGETDGWKAVSAAVIAMSDLAKQLESKIDTIAAFKGDIDTRLQGSSNKTSSGSYWDQLVKTMTSVGAINPYFKQETFAENIRTLVNKGIAFDIEQRAFLMTIQSKIANTFDVADGTLLRLIRIQQEDSSAGRLGMESALNAFLNEMYETSEYLTDVAKSVRSSLQEMESLMSGADATEVEYQVQKWLGSLYSVGMSQEATQSIANALGQIAAGQVEGITNGGAGNLLIMAANDAGLSIADILTDGINASDTNELLQAAVNYLAELSDSAADNKIVQQQLASVFGVKASDLKAATNLVLPGTVNNIYGNSMSYSNMLNRLTEMASSMGKRTSMAEMMTNLWENGQYSLAGAMASNPVSYFIYKMAKVVDDAAGGIDLPFVNVMGFGVDLNTTLSDLMRVAAVGAGLLGSIGPLISGIGNSFSGRSMLEQLGIAAGSGLAVTPRGTGSSAASYSGGGAQTTSESGYVGNASGSDIKNSTIAEANDSKKQQMIEAKEEAETNQVDILNTTVLKIYELLDDVAHGNSSLSVKVESYGLTKAGSGGAQGGVSALGDTGSSGGLSANSSSSGGSLNLGGWTSNI